MKTQSKTTSTLATPSITNVRDSKDELKNPGMTEDTVLNLSGTADLNSVVSLYDHSMRVGTASVVAPGVWKISPLAAPVGPHSFTIRAPDGASSPPWVITVGPIELDLEMPTVAQAPSGILNPMDAVANLSVWVPQYDDMRGTDKISVTWTGAVGTPAGGSHTTAPVDVGTVGAKQISLPVSLVAFSLDKSVSVSYTVTRDGRDHGSEVLPLVILPLLASALDKPTIRQAANNGEGPELDVSALTANATVRANDWPLIALNQPVWLQLRGIKADGSAYTKQVWSGASGSVTNAAWIRDGYYDAAVSYAELQGLKDASSLTVEFKAGLGGSRVESEAVAFPVRTYTVKALAIVTPEITSVKDAAGVEIPANQTTFSTSVTITGTATAGQSVQVFDGTTSLGIVPATGGNWTIALSSLAVKAYSVKARGLYGDNPESAVRSFTIAAATAPTISSIKDAAGVEIPAGQTTFSTSVTLTGTAVAGQQVQIFDGTTSLGTVPATDGNWTLALSSLAVKAYSIKARGLYGSNPESQVRAFHVINPLNIGADHSQAVDSYIIVRGRPPVPSPVRATYTRVATGGLPPYSYVSSDTNVAFVNATTGLVHACGNGVATITVMDSSGGRASYRMIFSGIQEVQILHNVYWAVSGPDRAWVASALSAAEFRIFWSNYYPLVGSVTSWLGWPASYYWTSTDLLGSPNAYSFVLSGTVVGGEVVTHGATRLPTVIRR